jgi:hypothetical protein
MLKVATTQDTTQNIIAPTVYINRIDKENGSYNIYYSLIDNKNEWITNEEALNSLNVYLSDGITISKTLLKTILVNNKVKNNTVSENVIFNNTSSFFSVTAWCGNESLSGSVVKEIAVTNGNIATVSTGTASLEYLSKVYNWDVLNFDININKTSPVISNPAQRPVPIPRGINTTVPTNQVAQANRIIQNSAIYTAPQSPLESELLVGYTPSKVANLGFVFNIETFLKNNSAYYNILSKNNNYKEIILRNSQINTNLSYFSKKNVTKKNKDYTKISNKIDSKLINLANSRYYVCVADDNTLLTDNSYYDVKVHLEIDDYSRKFIGETILSSIQEASALLSEYKTDFETISNNKNIDDVNQYIFENLYEKKIQRITNFINNISPLCSTFSDETSEEQFVTLFTSVLHPLFTDQKSLNKLSLFIEKLYKAIYALSSASITVSDTSVKSREASLIFEKQFGKSDKNPDLADFNYDYDANYGIEVLSVDKVDERAKTEKYSLKELLSQEWEARKILEARKYFANPTAAIINTIKLLSVSSVAFKSEEYQLLVGLSQASTNLFNDAYVKAYQYNNLLKDYRKPEAYFFALSGDGINIKTISARNNASTNNLVASTVFDSNSDTKQQSLKFMTDTNIKNLFYYNDKYQFVSLEQMKGEAQYKAATDPTQNSVYAYSDSKLQNPDEKAKIVFYYNSIYEPAVINSNPQNDIDIYSLTAKCVNSIFTDRLRLFNQVFAVRRKTTTVSTPPNRSFNVKNDILVNVLPIYLNRVTTAAKINVSTADL